MRNSYANVGYSLVIIDNGIMWSWHKIESEELVVNDLNQQALAEERSLLELVVYLFYLLEICYGGYIYKMKGLTDLYLRVKERLNYN